jgi:hypothetical protein
LRDLDEHRSVFDIDYVPGSPCPAQAESTRVGLADVDEAGGNKRILKAVQLEVRGRPFAHDDPTRPWRIVIL